MINYDLFGTSRKLNPDMETRDKLIFGEFNPKSYCGGIRHFENLSTDTLKTLLEKNFIEATERQNNAPSTEQILRFMERYPEYSAHGYAVSINRSDYRVTLEGVDKGCGADSSQELQEFSALFDLADSLNTATMHCWFD